MFDYFFEKQKAQISWNDPSVQNFQEKQISSV